MDILIDTNVLIDYFTGRMPFYHDAAKIVGSCLSGRTNGYVAFHSLSNIFYILMKQHVPRPECIDILRQICQIFTVCAASHERVEALLDEDPFDDLEDGLQIVCADEIEAGAIVTRDPDDFAGAMQRVCSPSEFLKDI